MRKIAIIIFAVLTGISFEMEGQQTSLNFDNYLTSTVCNPFQITGSNSYASNRRSGSAWSVSHGTPTLFEINYDYNRAALASSTSGNTVTGSEGLFSSYTFLPTHKYKITVNVRYSYSNPTAPVPGFKVFMANGLTHTNGSGCSEGSIPTGIASMQVMFITDPNTSLYIADNIIPDKQYNFAWIYSLMTYQSASNYVVIEQILIEDKGLTCNITLKDQTNTQSYPNRTSVIVEPVTILNPGFFASSSTTCVGARMSMAEQLTGVEESNVSVEDVNGFLVYPNPATEEATVAIELKNASRVKVLLSDLMGREVMTIAEGTYSSLKQSFSVGGLKKGIYNVSYFVDGAATKTELLMVR